MLKIVKSLHTQSEMQLQLQKCSQFYQTGWSGRLGNLHLRYQSSTGRTVAISMISEHWPPDIE